LGVSIFEDTEYANLQRTWAGILAERRDRILYNIISVVYGVHDSEFAHRIQKDAYDQIYGQEYLEERAERLLKLYKQLEQKNGGGSSQQPAGSKESSS